MVETAKQSVKERHKRPKMSSGSIGRIIDSVYREKRNQLKSTFSSDGGYEFVTLTEVYDGCSDSYVLSDSTEDQIRNALSGRLRFVVNGHKVTIYA